MLKTKTTLSRLCLAGIALATLGLNGTMASANADKAPTRSDSGAGELALPQQNDPWFVAARQRLEAIKSARPETKTAKNVILFIGDGMSLATITAGGIFEGQKSGGPGEGNFLSFETLPYVGLAKTYTTNYQTPDSAGTATAMVAGVKTKSLIISLDDSAVPSKCGTGNSVMTMMELAEQAGLATGVVTTTRLTHATPATNYAHSPNRNWEADTMVTNSAERSVINAVTPGAADAKNDGCADIASQLIDFPYGDGPEVAMGGGRRMFLPNTVMDPEVENMPGMRKDGRDLTAEWLASNPGAAYVWNKASLEDLNLQRTSRLLGLFELSHMQFEHDRENDKGGEPSLSQMTKTAIDMLSRNRDGYYLMVESGRIDHAHHGTNAHRALTDTVEFSKAVRMAMENTDPEDTLIIVTADHGHTISISGYSSRGNPILGKARSGESEISGTDGMPYTTLSYANGPSAKKNEPRADLSEVDVLDPNFRQPSLVPMMSETHSGEDVAVYASGPGASWLSGVYEQNYIFHVMEEAMQLRQKAAR